MLLMDVSNSMQGTKTEDAKEALIQFLKKVDLNRNKVGLTSFGYNINIINMSQERSYLEEQIRQIRANGGTPMYSAMKKAYENLLINKGNSVMVIATDGIPTDQSEETILQYGKTIKKRGAWIITIRIGEDANKFFLKELASSPDDYYFAKDSLELKEIYKNISNVLALPSS